MSRRRRNFDPRMSVARARAWVLAHRDAGVECPCCEQLVKVYRRKVNHQMARALIALVQAAGPERNYVHWPDLCRSQRIEHSADEAKCVFWGLIEPMPDLRHDGSNRNGFWRPTKRGVAFVLNRTVIRECAFICINEVIAWDGKEDWSIVDALNTRFNYRDLMGDGGWWN